MRNTYTGAELFIARQKQLKEVRKELDNLKEFINDTKTLKSFNIYSMSFGCDIKLIEQRYPGNNIINEIIRSFRSDKGFKEYNVIEENGIYKVENSNIDIIDNDEFRKAYDSIRNMEILKYRGFAALNDRNITLMHSSYAELIVSNEFALCQQSGNGSIMVSASREEELIDDAKLEKLLVTRIPYGIDLDRYLDDKEIIHDYEFAQDFYGQEELCIEETPKEYILYLKD